MTSGGGGVAVPERLMECGLALVLSKIQIVSDCVPRNVGVNRTVIEQLWFFAYSESVAHGVEQVKDPPGQNDDDLRLHMLAQRHFFQITSE